MVNQEKQQLKFLIDNFYKLNRVAISDEHNTLIRYIAEKLNCNPLSFEADTYCLTWKLPKSWTVKEAYLMDSNGDKIVDYINNPLHLWSYSIPFSGYIEFSELNKHLVYNEKYPDRIAYHYRNQYTYGVADWGFSMPYNLYKTLKDEKYYVNIDTTLDTRFPMEIIDYTINTNGENIYLFSAHTCHPAIVTDGLACVGVLLQLIERLKHRKNLKNAYKFIFGPEFYAAAAYLSVANEDEVKKIKGTIYLDMLGNNEPICWQTSFYGNSYIDKVTKNVMNSVYGEAKRYGYRQLWGNDETIYNGPGFLIPSVGIGGDKFDNYHFHTDNNEFVSYDDLINSIDLIEKIVEVLENDYTPILCFKGALYLSQYGLYYDSKIYPDAYRNIESILIMADGNRTILEICTELNIDFSFAFEFFEKLRKLKLCEKNIC